MKTIELNSLTHITQLTDNINNVQYKEQINEILKEYQKLQDIIKYSKISNRRQLGIYYTNFNIAYQITTETIQYNAKEIQKLKFYEPCVGLGIFVITYIEYILNNFKLSENKLIRTFNNIYFSDIDESAIFLAKKLIEKFIKIKTNIDFKFSTDNIFIGNVLTDDSFNIRDTKSIFNKNIKFDLILTNPPYRNLKASTKELNGEELEAFQNYCKSLSKSIRYTLKLQQGTINLYKAFVELIYKSYSTNEACIGLIIPSTLLSDYTSTLLRKEIFQNSIVQNISILSENSKEFKNVAQSMCYFGSKKVNHIVNNSIKIIDDSSEEDFDNIDISHIEDIDSSFTLMKLSHEMYKVLNKIHSFPKLKDIDNIVNLRGELDLTLHKQYIQENESKYNLLQGKNIKEWSFAQNDLYVNENFISDNKTPKVGYIQSERLICHQISNMKSKKRLKFSKIPKGYILGNSCNFIALKDKKIDINFLLGILNSYLMDWRFKLFSSNNHINNYELDDLPLNIDSKCIRQISKYVDEILNGDRTKTIELNILVFELYGLNRENILEVLRNYDDEFSKILKERYSKIKLYNHTINKVSDLDLEMILSIPEGGNWKNIPKTIPSKRLEGIRKTGGRTTLYGRLSWDKPSYTISTYFTRPGNGTYIHPNDGKYTNPKHRLITPREAARLQSFPDYYKFLGSKSSIATQIGNAVPPILGYVVARELKKYLTSYNVIDLFSGAGGLGLGFKKAGYNIIVANDNFKAAAETYRFNHPETKYVEGDITQKETKNKISNIVKEKNIDVICGGPPCQGFSLAGKRLSDDPRNFLFKEFINLVAEFEPKIFVMENVQGIVSSNGGKTYMSIIEEFSSLGYVVTAQIFNTINYGVPQARKRVIIVGSKTKDFTFDISPIIKDSKNFITVKDAISNLTEVEPHKTESELDFYPKPNSDYQKYLAGQISVEEFLKSISNFDEIKSKT